MNVGTVEMPRDSASTRGGRWRSIWRYGLIGGLIAAATVMFGVGLITAFFERMFAPVESSERLLLYNTDHQQLLYACELVLANPQASGFPKSTNSVTSIDGPGAGVPTMPAA